MARRFNLNKAVNEYCLTATSNGRFVNMESVVEYVAELADRLAENVRKSVLPLMMEKMARVDDDTFVDDASLDFDVKQIDALIEKRMNGASFLPLQAFEPFKGFPPFSNNWGWNIFVFETYCLKYSHRFKRVSLLFNKQCTGAIVSVDDDRSFHEILLDAVVSNPALPLVPEKAILHLKSAGLIGKAKYDRIGELIEEAAALRAEYSDDEELKTRKKTPVSLGRKSASKSKEALGSKKSQEGTKKVAESACARKTHSLRKAESSSIKSVSNAKKTVKKVVAKSTKGALAKKR